MIDFDDERVPGVVYTRSHVEEAFPDVLGPLAWSLLHPALEAGQRLTFVDHYAVLTTEEADTMPFYARFDGLVHRNASVLKIAASRALAVSTSTIERAIPGPVADEGRVPGATRRALLASRARTLRTLAGQRRRLAAVDAAAARADATTDALLASTPDAAALVAHIRHLVTELGIAVGSHHSARALALAVTDGAGRAVGRLGVDWQASYASGDSSWLPSAAPALALAAADPDVSAIAARWPHLGPGAGDPTRSTWGTDPQTLERFVAAIGDRAQRPAATPAVVLRAGRPAPLTRFVVAVARTLWRLAVADAERSKDAVLRVTHAMRLVVDRLRAVLPATTTLAAADLDLCTLEEVAAQMEGRAGPSSADLGRRRRQLDEAASTGTGIAPTPRRDGEVVVRGIGATGGVVIGRATVASTPTEAVGAAVVVARGLDATWLAVLPRAAAVVVEQGGILGHTTIVVRELGLVAVVGAHGATAAIRDGDVVRVDGNNGEVTVVFESSGAVMEDASWALR